MSSENSWKPEGEEEEEEIGETQYKQTKDAILFAIDVSESMLTSPPKNESKKADTDSPLSAALKCAYSLMQQRIISNPNDMMGILLFGTEQTKFPEDEKLSFSGNNHCYLLTDIAVPSAEDVKALRTLVDDEEEFNKLQKPAKKRVDLGDVFFIASQLFADRAADFSSRRLFIVTDNDEPPEQKDVRNIAIVRAKDLYDLDVVIELFPIAKPDSEFDRKKFYNDIVYTSTPSSPEAPAPLLSETRTSTSGDGITLLSSLLSTINSRIVPKRAQFSNMPFEIGPGLTISVKGYIIFKHQDPARSCYVWARDEKTQIVKLRSTYHADDTPGEVDKSQVRRAYRFSGEQISFSLDEIKNLRNCFGDPIIRIIGFKPLNAKTLPIWANMGRSTFIYPSEDDYVGSQRVFSALQQKLLVSHKFALAWHIPRRDASPVIVAILSSSTRVDDTGESYLPAGLWLIPLPFADDIRTNPETVLASAPDPVIDKMREIIQQLQLPRGQFVPAKYPNPALQWHYRILQAMALDEDLPTKPEDKTTPKYKQIAKRAGHMVEEWKAVLEKEHRDLAIRGSKAGEKRSGGDGGATGKRIKLEEQASQIGDKDVRAAYQRGGIAKLTVAELKGWMGTKALDTSGKKADLVERVEAWFESQ